MNDLIEVLKTLPLGGVGFGALVAFAIRLIFKGDIIPRATYEAMLKSKDAENDLLKQAYVMSEEARKTSAEADTELLELGRTTVHLLESIHDRAWGET